MKVWAYKVDGQLRCAVIPEAIPRDMKVTEIEVDDPNDVTLDEKGDICFRSREEKNRERNQFIEEQRKLTYQNESDPLFFKEQRGEVSKGTWLAKVEEIRKRLPYFS